ncbi:MAG: FAD-binding protein, partial [Chloroflexi bacterium]|nr:FAD-binding protein [Chloroflexota bacterium]
MINTDARWDRSADVVVIGNGLAGATTAITARESGSEVLILEKSGIEGFHSNSSMAGVSILGSSDVKGTIQYLEGLNRINGDIDGDAHWT